MNNDELLELFHSNALLTQAYLKHLRKHPSPEAILLLSLVEPFLPIELSRKLRRIVHPHKQNHTSAVIKPIAHGPMRKYLVTSTLKYGLAPDVFRELFTNELRARPSILKWRVLLSGSLLGHLRGRMHLANEYKVPLAAFLKDQRIQVFSQAVAASALCDEIDDVFIHKLKLCIQSSDSLAHSFGLEGLYYRLKRKHRLTEVANTALKPLIDSQVRTKPDGSENFRKSLIKKIRRIAKK